jgi:hypothetical protein
MVPSSEQADHQLGYKLRDWTTRDVIATEVIFASTR